jgi:hypothetical protein
MDPSRGRHLSSEKRRNLVPLVEDLVNSLDFIIATMWMTGVLYREWMMNFAWKDTTFFSYRTTVRVTSFRRA